MNARPMKIVILNLCDATEENICLLASYYATAFLHFRNEIWMEDLTGERLRTLNDLSGVMLTLEKEVMEKWLSVSGVEVLRDHFKLNSTQQIKFCTTLLKCRRVKPEKDGLHYTFTFPYIGVFKHTQQHLMTYE